MFAQTLAILAPIVICTLAGYVWKRFHQPFDNRMVSLLVTEVTAPCLVMATLGKLAIAPQHIVQVGMYIAVAVLCMTVMSYLALRLTGFSWRTFAATMIFGNHGYMGMPLCLFAFGEQGLALAVIYFAITALFHNTLGIATVSGKTSLRFVVTSPVILATLLSLVLIFTGTHLPSWAHNSLALLGQITIPLMLFALGVALAGMAIRHWHKNLLLAVLRLCICLLTGFGVAALFELEGIIRQVIILEAAMPAAIFNYILAERYRQSPDEVASVIALSTLTTFLALPVLITLLL
jgi:predicted permease